MPRANPWHRPGEPVSPVFVLLTDMSMARQRNTPAIPSKEATVSDAELVVRCQAGDGEAFEVLYRRHAARVYALACRMAGSADEGEDLLQEIFLQAYRKLGSFKGDATLGTWLYRLALNHCLDFVRSRQAKNRKLTDAFDEASFERTVSRDTAIARIDLERAVRTLPNGCREAFVLHDVEGFDHKEVGRMLGIAEGTSKSQVFKARMKLRECLSQRT
jgi:RNA polymerase sigma-70 factor, ECF subfamily